MAKPILHRFVPSTDALKLLAEQYISVRNAKRKAADDSQWRKVETYERQMVEIRVKLTQLVAARLVANGKIPRSKKHDLSIRYQTTPWGDDYWVWFTQPVYMMPLKDEL